MNILFLLSWKYPGYGAASKRITNYKNGLSAEGNKIEIKSIYSLYKNPFQSLINGLLMPLLTIIELLKNKNKTDIILVYGFGWISKLIIVFYGNVLLKDVSAFGLYIDFNINLEVIPVQM